MGVSDLWTLLRSEGMVREWNCETDGQLAQKKVAEKLEGKFVAVDVSLWTCQALTQGALVEVFESEEARVIKVAFDRIINYLRFGCNPVAVLDGEAPDEKLETLQARFYSRFNRAGGGGGNSHFVHLCSLTAQLFKAMGLWVVQAPGEAEAMCAALDRAGHVDACVTKDSDALLFGAQTLFQTIKPVTCTPNECKLASMGMGEVRAYLGIEEGGELALTAIALLTGGDYHMGGAERVGQRQALAVVKHLLRGQKNDADVLTGLAGLLAQPPEDHAEVLSHEKCTGCKRCGHEGGRKGRINSHSARNPCDCCPPAHDGTCREHARSSCSCAFHRLEPLRVVYKAIQKARDSPDFVARAAAAEQTYQEQMDDAAEAVAEFAEQHSIQPAQRLVWRHRPNVAKVARLVERCGLPWDEMRTRGKMMALLMEWDAGHPGTQAEFVPSELVKPHGSQEDRCWRHLMAWKRTTAGSPEDVAVDRERLQEKGKSAEFRCLRFATVRECWPALLRAYEQKRAEAAENAAKKEARRADKEGRAVPAQTAAQSKDIARMAATMHAFLQPQRKQQAAAKAAAKSASAPSGSHRGLGNLRPSPSGRGGDALGSGARADGAAEAAEQEAGPSGRERADAALTRRLGLHSSSSDESRGGSAAFEGGAWADLLADDGETTPRETGAAVADPPGLHSPSKRGRGSAAAAPSSPEAEMPDSRSAEADGGTIDGPIVLESPEKRRRMPGAAAAAPGQCGSAAAEPSCPDRAAGQEAAAHSGQPAAAGFSIRQRPALPSGRGRGGRGRGRRAADAAAGTPQIERFLQRQLGVNRARGSYTGDSAAQGTPSRGAGTQAEDKPHPFPGSPIDLTQSASPQWGPRDGDAGASQHCGSRNSAATVLRSSDERCLVEREIEELLHSRGVRRPPSPAERTPAARPGRQLRLDFATPSTDGDIVLDLVTPPSSQTAGE